MMKKKHSQLSACFFRRRRQNAKREFWLIIYLIKTEECLRNARWTFTFDQES